MVNRYYFTRASPLLNFLNLLCVNPPHVRQDVRVHGSGGAPVRQGDAHAAFERRSCTHGRHRGSLRHFRGREGEVP